MVLFVVVVVVPSGSDSVVVVIAEPVPSGFVFDVSVVVKVVPSGLVIVAVSMSVADPSAKAMLVDVIV